MSGQLQATSLLYVVWAQSRSQGMPRKGQYGIDANMLQLQVGGRRGTTSHPPSRLEARQERDAKEKFTEGSQD
jgi:hypothetical protein